MGWIYCAGCRAQISAHAPACPYCGHGPVHQADVPPTHQPQLQQVPQQYPPVQAYPSPPGAPRMAPQQGFVPQGYATPYHLQPPQAHAPPAIQPAQGQHSAQHGSGPQLPGYEPQEANSLVERIELLRRELASVEDELEIQSFGLYEPRYGLENAAAYKARIAEVRKEQKTLIKNDRAAVCGKDWRVGGSAAKGKKMIGEHKKLMLRAFNGECDAAIIGVRYDNVERLQARIEKSFRELNKLGASKHIAIVDDYLALKVSELLLVHEHRDKVQEEKEEQRRIRQEMREEQKAEEEIEKAQRTAQKEEHQFQKALDKARAELAAASGAQHNKLEHLVTDLEARLSEALDRKAKAIARAQLTRSGHVYVLSNVGSFGEGIYKIGMTRRLEPLDRVHELGDASVPFRFDVHAMVYCEDAPALEKALHDEFAARRVNKVNLRREYFRVTLEEIQEAIARHHGQVTFVMVPEAEEYRRSRSAAEFGGDPSQGGLP